MKEARQVSINIRVSRKSSASLTRQITEQLSSLIKTGALPADTFLPSERTLAKALNVARNVVRGSYECLRKAGLVTREGRKGLRVCKAARPAAAKRAATRHARKR
jgi:DNA-binding FadR family transcriptional regulator